MKDYRVKCIIEKGDYCNICGERENVDVHHIDGNRTNNELKNLIPVCRYCHIGIHENRENYEHWHARLLSWYDTSSEKPNESHTLSEDSTSSRMLADNLIFINGLTSSEAKKVVKMENKETPFRCPECGETCVLTGEYSLRNRKNCSNCEWVGAVYLGVIEAIPEESDCYERTPAEVTD